MVQVSQVGQYSWTHVSRGEAWPDFLEYSVCSLVVIGVCGMYIANFGVVCTQRKP